MTGPLLVFSERVGVEEETDEQQVVLHEVVAYDLGADRYWTAFEYRHVRPRVHGALREGFSAVQPAGTSLVVWSEGQVRRMSLNGEMEALLLEDHVIREIEVSPDGTKVAVMSGEPGTLLVLDAASGEELLRVEGDNPDLGTLQGGGRHGRLALGDWHADGNAVSITADDYTAILPLDGDIRVLPEGSRVSSDLRYAIHFGEVVGLLHHALVWDKLDVLDAVTGRVLWTITDEAGIRRSYKEPFWVDESRYVAFTFGSNGAERILDTASGEILPLTSRITRPPDDRVPSTCGAVEFGSAGSPCDVKFEGRVVWEGATGWTYYLGLIEIPGRLTLRGITPLEAVRKIPPPPPPRREEMVGPLLAFEVRGDYEYVSDSSGGSRSIPTRRIIVYDEGTGRSWSLSNRTDWSRSDYSWSLSDFAEEVQVARGGIVLVSNPLGRPYNPRLLYLAPDGQVEPLDDSWFSGKRFRVSPDGLKVVLKAPGRPAVVLSIPSGNEILRLDDEDIVSSAGLDPSRTWRVGLVGGGVANAWTSDSAAILINLMDYGTRPHDSAQDERGGIVTFDGAVHALPCGPNGRTRTLSCLSPDARYIAHGRFEDSGGYTDLHWRRFDIIESATGRVLWTVDVPGIPDDSYREWASPEHFAWSAGVRSSGIFNFATQRVDSDAPSADVSVLDVNTGEIEVMDSADYLARFHPPLRATTDCSENPGQPCKILLDGEVVGEGRWPRIIGIIELDE